MAILLRRPSHFSQKNISDNICIDNVVEPSDVLSTEDLSDARHDDKD